MSQEERDQYYIGIAQKVSERSRCRSRKVGAVLVQNDRIVATGFNGPPMGMRPCDQRYMEDRLYDGVGAGSFDGTGRCPRQVFGFKSGVGLELCVAAHAERNALLSAALNGISTKGATLYCFCGRPCKDCMIEIVNAGVAEVVFIKKDSYYDELSGVVARECGIVQREVEFSE